MAPPQSPHDTNISLKNAPWAVTVELEGVDLDFMEEGLFWTTQNVLFLAGCQDILDTAAVQEEYHFPWAQNVIRTWELREFPGKPEARSRWHGEVTLRTRSAHALAGFRLGQLTRQMICRAWVFDDEGKMIFRFNPESTTAMNKNELFDGDPFDLWWLWPMESIIPEEEAEGSSCSQAGGGEEKRAPEGRVTDARVSWPDVAVLLCAAPAMSILAVAWGGFVLLTAASTAVLEFGRDKTRRESELHATDYEPSWKELAAHLFTEFIQLFKGTEGPTWWDLVWGSLFIVWGIGGFGLVAIAVVRNT